MYLYLDVKNGKYNLDIELRPCGTASLNLRTRQITGLKHPLVDPGMLFTIPSVISRSFAAFSSFFRVELIFMVGLMLM